MNWRSRWAFWAMAALVLALVSVPSIELLSNLIEYRRFLSGWEPTPLKNTSTSFTPHESGRLLDETALKPVEFLLKAPKAKSVELVGDFNAWRPGLLKMSRDGDGAWNAVVPMPAGRHRYLFLVDGEPRVDETMETENGPQGRRVMLRTVK